MHWFVFAFHWTFWDFFSEPFLSVETKTSVRGIVSSSVSIGEVLHGVGSVAKPGGIETGKVLELKQQSSV